jgi:hypothetical protein
MVVALCSALGRSGLTVHKKCRVVGLFKEKTMKSATRQTSDLIAWGVIAVGMTLFLAYPNHAAAQGSQGQNAVYQNSTTIVGSSAFIDASQFATPADTICSTIYRIFKGPPTYSAAVIDARGFPGNSGASMTCSAGTTPWNNGTTYLNKPSTILLPAGTIFIPTTWVLPNNTRIIGAGDALDYLSKGTVSVGTTLQACKSAINGCSFNTNNTDMIDLGSPSCPITGGTAICNDVAVENLTLDALGQSLNGIVNTNAQAGSYVDHVSLFQIRGTGLWLEDNANYSGPYSNITFDSGSFGAVGPCVNINGLSSTHGIHGLTCISASTDAPAAVLLDSSNNSMEDESLASTKAKEL